MMQSLSERSPQVGDTFAEASEALAFDLWQLVTEGPEEELNRTERTQPAMLAADIATWRVWREQGGADPDYMAGHSLGEYAALVASGALAFRDAVPLVAARGRLMQEATPPGVGAMAAVLGLDDAALEALCAEHAGDQVVSCANYNSPGQVVIAGHREAVERVSEAARAAGARRAVTLPVSVPSHCALMREAAGHLAVALEAIDLAPPRIPVLHNADVESHSSIDEIRAVLAAQLWQPVQWTRTVSSLRALGVERFVECGPGRVLSGLNRRICRDANTVALTDLDALTALIEEDS
jgi:[acyl-carrier-protein] S-malonyltransferase